MNCNCQKKECEKPLPEWSDEFIDYKFYCPPYLSWVGRLKTNKGNEVRVIKYLPYIYTKIAGEPYIETYYANLLFPGVPTWMILLQNNNFNLIPFPGTPISEGAEVKSHKIIGVWK